jgi:putative acetyltransferase
MRPLYQDPWFTFRFAEDRIISRFQLDGIAAGRRVAVFKINPTTGERSGLLATALAGAAGWVDLPEPMVVRAGDAFIAVPAVAPLIRPENPGDHEAIRRVNRLAFGQEAEARLVDALRAEGYLRVSLVAAIGNQVVGHILFSDLPILTEAGLMPALSLAPMAVLPEFQGQGIGSALVRDGLAACRLQGHRIVIVVGHPHFYRRFGFSSERAKRLESPYAGEAFMAVELEAGALDGVTGRVEYPAPFAQVDSPPAPEPGGPR